MFSTKKAILAAAVLIGAIGLTIKLLIPTQSEGTKQAKTATTKSSDSIKKTEEQATPKSKEEQLDSLVSQMSLDEKIGQLFLARVPETNQLEDIKTYHLGGYLLFARDVEGETSDTLKTKIDSFQQESDVPMLIASDEEGGTVTRISKNDKIVTEPFKSPQDLYKAGGIEAVKKDIDYKSNVFKVLGIHTGLYPVADVSTDPESFIYDRTIGLNTAETSSYLEEVVTELKKNEIGSTLKHFPGMGDNLDSHSEIVTDNRSLDEIKTTSLPPFEAGIKAGADSILVSHNIVKAIDPNVPASISPKVNQLLRDELKFNGVVMTDDMDMAGLADFTTQETAALEALKAGNDLILSSSYDKQIPVIKSAVQSGEYSEEQLNQSVLRILKWKSDLGIITLD
ncbi:MAG: glycoside hydrolase family 3 N-terminal domain-containing protein [Vagococcus sp.]|uniref:glycoside hydrolase family 3 N-terminal domain-containing protein n=1 Tax=Vagococcus TaxID=2737 RepID=UPI002FCB9AB9